MVVLKTLASSRSLKTRLYPCSLSRTIHALYKGKRRLATLRSSVSSFEMCLHTYSKLNYHNLIGTCNLLFTQSAENVGPPSNRQRDPINVSLVERCWSPLLCLLGYIICFLFTASWSRHSYRRDHHENGHQCVE